MPKSTLRTKLTLAFTLLLLGFSLLPAAAAEPAQAISLNVEASFQGYFKYGEWLPVWVTLDNAGADLEGEVQVSIVRDFEQITYAVPVSLANGARKRFAVYVKPNNFTHELKVDLVADNSILSSQNIKVQPQPNINYLIGVAAPERGALGLLTGISLPGGRLPVILDIALETLPEQTAAMRSLDCLILNDIDSSSLTPEQIDALTGWVQQGGRLVIGGGAGALQTTAGLPDELLPLQPTDLVDLNDLGSLAEFANTVPVRVPGPFVVATGIEYQGQTLVAQDGLPLIQEMTPGDGYITFVALDLSATPFNAWTGTPVFWETIIAPGASYPAWRPPDMSLQQLTAGPINNALSNLPSLDLPSVKNVALLLGLYILLVGPVNYLILRWRKKLHWAWVSIPLITLVFTGLSFGIAYAKRGTDLIINKIAIIDVQPQGPAQVNSYIGIFSPANQSYEIEVSGDNLLSPMSDMYNPWMSSIQPGQSTSNLTFIQSNPGLVRGLTVNQWAMQSFMTETSLEEIEQIQANLYLEGNKLVGTITNTSGHLLEDTLLVLSPNFVRLGDIEPGASVEIELAVGNSGNIFNGGSISWRIYEQEINPAMQGPPPRELEFKRMILEALIDQQYYYGMQFDPSKTRSATELTTELPEITFLGWMDNAPPEVRINGQRPQETATGIYLTKIPFQIPQTGEVSVPPGLIPGLIAEMPFSAGTCGVETTSLWMEKGEAVLEFILLPQLSDLNIANLNLSLRTDGGWVNSPDLAIYDWETEEWTSLDKSIIGENIITEPEGNISPDGLVRFRLSINDQVARGGGCYYFGLGLEGSY